MKKLFLIASISITLFLVSCDNTERKQTETPKAVEPKTVVKKIESVTPNSIGVSKITTKFISYPKCDGGECYDVEFTIGVKIKGEQKSRVIPVRAGGYVKEKNGAKTQESVLEAEKLHKKMISINPKKVIVTLVDNQVTKIILIEEWQGKIFTPETVLWEIKNY